MAKPTGKQLCDATGISPSYASMILSDGANARTPPRSLAVAIYRALGWRHPSIERMNDEQLAASEMLDPWVRPADRLPAEQAA